MPNPNYIKGRRKEYKIVHEERDKGNIAFRSAGSHSPIDVVSINKETKTITLIQSKPDNYTNNQINNILKEQNDLNGFYLVRFVVK